MKMFSRVLSEDAIERIHSTSLQILERVGVHVPHPEVLARFAGAGAAVDFATQRARIPPALVLRSLEQCGKSFSLYGRDLNRTARFGQGTRNYNSVSGEALWLDDVAQPRRYATLQDVSTAARFGDALECLNIVGAMADPHEVDVRWRCVEVMAALLRNTTKPVGLWYYNRASARYLNEIMVAVRGDEQRAASHPLAFPFLEPISPLRFPFHGVDLLFETARLNLPVPIGPMAQMGLSAPGTVAGTLAQENAEILAGVCITQLIKPGLPVCYGGICHAFDMRTTQLIFSGPEQAIFSVALAQLGKRYGLPVYINVGLTDAKRPDAQAGLEASLTLMLGAAAGADIFGHMGISGVDQASSLDVLVMQHEVIRYVESVMREVDCGEDALGLAEIEAVGPGGMFIDREHTAASFRRELWFPRLLDREYYDAWLNAGATSMEERCRAYKNKVLAQHQSEPLDEALARAINEIVATARNELSRVQQA
jgi:trimethylamine---corrinoid protein Co-methyltransferase